jgi:hypothetical protein
MESQICLDVFGNVFYYSPPSLPPHPTRILKNKSWQYDAWDPPASNTHALKDIVEFP